MLYPTSTGEIVFLAVLTLVGVLLIIPFTRIRHALGKAALVNVGGFALGAMVLGYLSVLSALAAIVLLWTTYLFVARLSPQVDPPEPPAAHTPEPSEPAQPRPAVVCPGCGAAARAGGRCIGCGRQV